MKKHMFAILAISALGASYAQAGPHAPYDEVNESLYFRGEDPKDTVTLYGQIDEGFVIQENTSAAKGYPKETYKTQGGVTPGITGQNRIGIRATEGLGGGASAVAVVELGFNNEGMKGDNVREAWVGISHDDNETSVRLGRINTATSDFISATNVSGSSLVPGSISHNHLTNFDKVNGIQLTTRVKDLNLYGSYGYVSAQTPEEKGKTRFYELAAETVYDGAYVRTAYANQLFKESAYGLGDYAVTAHSFYGSVGYKLPSVAHVSYTFVHNKVTDDETGFTRQVAIANQHQIGVSGNVTPDAELYANYAYGKGHGNAAIDDRNEILEGKYYGYQVGMRYNLSKRTNTYVAYGHQQTDFELKPTLVYKENTIAVGIKHTF